LFSQLTVYVSAFLCFNYNYQKELGEAFADPKKKFFIGPKNFLEEAEPATGGA